MKTKMLLALFLIPFVISCSQGSGKGKRIDFTQKLNLGTGQFAQLFIPDYYQPPADGKFLLVFHFHSASWAAEDEVYKAKANAVLFNIHLGGLSSPYRDYFSHSERFCQILNYIKEALKQNGIINNPEIKNLIVTSFSAGYAGVREVLKSQSYYDKIDAITLADGLHSNLDSTWMKIQMQDFLRFAKDARDEKKIMLLTHSSIPTPTYASTTQTANYLIHFIGAKRVSYFHTDEIGQQYSRCDTGYFHLKGYYGTTAEDHLKHLYGMHLMLEKALDLLYNSTGVKQTGEKAYGYYLKQNFPNPFGTASRSGSGTTTIKFSLPKELQDDFVSLNIYDVLGRKVLTLFENRVVAGESAVTVDEKNLASGIYFYTLSSPGFSLTKKMILLK